MKEPRRRSVMDHMGGAVPIILVINIVVFLMWWYSEGDREFYVFMRDNFSVSLTGVKNWRPWILLTAAFSHYYGMHLFVNMFVLYSFGTVMEKVLGTRRFVIFYLLGCFVASVAHVLLSLIPELGNTAGVGASGGVAAIMVLFAFMFPRQIILLFFVLPLPAILAAVLFVGYDAYSLIRQIIDAGFEGHARIGHGAHLGGAAFGVAYYFAFLKRAAGRSRRRRRGRRREESVDYTDPDASRMDFLLGKIQQGGLDSLTPEERDFMIYISEKMRRDS